MRRTIILLGWIGLCLYLSPSIYAQKGQISGGSSSGKSEIKGHSEPKSFNSAPSPSPSPSESKPRHSESNHSSYSSEPPSREQSSRPSHSYSESHSSDESHSSPASYSSPSNGSNGGSTVTPTHSAPSGSTFYQSAPPIPRNLGKPSDDDDRPAASPDSPKPRPGQAAPRPNFASATWDSELQTEVAAGPKSGRSQTSAEPRPRPDPLPTPPGGWGQSLGQSGAAGTIDLPPSDTAHHGSFGGIVLSAPPRPHFSRDTLSNFPAEAGPPKPKIPVSTSVLPDDSYSGGGAGDPYAYYTNLQFYFFSNVDVNVSYSGVAYPALECIYQAANQLERMYLAPNWCDAEFTRQYSTLLLEFRGCYRYLPMVAVEPWMWTAYLTYEDERNFWEEECVTGNKELMAIRAFLRAKAITVPFLMPSVDAQKTEDWTYVDTSFAAPFGGYNYYRTIQAYGPDQVVEKVNHWVKQFPNILFWPSYIRVADFHDNFYRSGFWALLEGKIDRDLDASSAALISGDAKAFQFSENAGWLCAAMLSLEPKNRTVRRQADRAVRLLEMANFEQWTRHPLERVLVPALKR